MPWYLAGGVILAGSAIWALVPKRPVAAGREIVRATVDSAAASAGFGPTVPNQATAPSPAPAMASLSSPRIRVSTGMMIGGGLLAAVSALLPWVTLADGTDKAGISSIPGIGTAILGLIVVAIGVFILLRADHPLARDAAWGGLVAALGVGAMGLIAVLTVDTASGAAVSLGVLPAIAGGMIATMGVRGLLEGR